MAKIPKIPLNHLKQLFRVHQALTAKAGEQTNRAIPFDFHFTAKQKLLPKKRMYCHLCLQVQFHSPQSSPV